MKTVHCWNFENINLENLIHVLESANDFCSVFVIVIISANVLIYNVFFFSSRLVHHSKDMFWNW